MKKKTKNQKKKKKQERLVDAVRDLIDENESYFDPQQMTDAAMFLFAYMVCNVQPDVKSVVTMHFVKFVADSYNKTFDKDERSKR